MRAVIWLVCRAAITTRARALATTGASQEEIVTALLEAFPGLPSDAYYLNPAACAVMRRMRIEQEREQGRAVDRARLRAKGLPESLADRRDALYRSDPRDGGRVLAWRGPADDMARSIQSCPTQTRSPDEAAAAGTQWPDHPGDMARLIQSCPTQTRPPDEQVHAVRTGGELLDLCRRYDLDVRYEAATGQLVLSRPLAMDSALYNRLRRFKPHLVRLLQATVAPLGAYDR